MKVAEQLTDLRGLHGRTTCGSARATSTIRCSACASSGRWARPRRATRCGRCASELARVKTVLREKGVKD